MTIDPLARAFRELCIGIAAAECMQSIAGSMMRFAIVRAVLHGFPEWAAQAEAAQIARASGLASGGFIGKPLVHVIGEAGPEFIVPRRPS